jgi:hypothetical protein
VSKQHRSAPQKPRHALEDIDGSTTTASISNRSTPSALSADAFSLYSKYDEPRKPTDSFSSSSSQSLWRRKLLVSRFAFRRPLCRRPYGGRDSCLDHSGEETQRSKAFGYILRLTTRSSSSNSVSKGTIGLYLSRLVTIPDDHDGFVFLAPPPLDGCSHYFNSSWFKLC